MILALVCLIQSVLLCLIGFIFKTLLEQLINLVETHFPPWEEASLYNGKRSEEQALPVFASKCMGEAIERSSNQNLECNHIVLAGHTHDPYCGKITNNIECRVGKARYEKPTYTIIEIE